jgi:hypothetical protein
MSIGLGQKLNLEKNDYSDKQEVIDKFKALEDKYTHDFSELEKITNSKIDNLSDKVSRNSLSVGMKPQDKTTHGWGNRG